jgi:hypothetical protein
MFFFVLESLLLFIQVMIEDHTLAAKSLTQKNLLFFCWVNPIFVSEKLFHAIIYAIFFNRTTKWEENMCSNATLSFALSTERNFLPKRGLHAPLKTQFCPLKQRTSLFR